MSLEIHKISTIRCLQFFGDRVVENSASTIVLVANQMANPGMGVELAAERLRDVDSGLGPKGEEEIRVGVATGP